MKTIQPTEVKKQLAAGKVLHLIDVREVEEVANDHIEGIKHIPLGLLEFRMHELNKSTPYIMICRSGGRSGQATAFLEAHGYDVTNMSGGMLEWNEI